MGNCSSTGSKFNSQTRFFKTTILDGDCTVGSSSNELGYGNLEVTRYELVLHQKGHQSVRWPSCSIIKYTSKGDIFILEYMSTNGVPKPEKRFFIVKGASLLCKFIQSQKAANSTIEKRIKPTGLSRSDDGGTQKGKENYDVLVGHNRMTSHPELDLAVSHYPPFPHPNQALYYNYPHPMQQYPIGPYAPYPNVPAPHPGFINGPPIHPIVDQWPVMAAQPPPMLPWSQGPVAYPTLLPAREDVSNRVNLRHQFSKALKHNSNRPGSKVTHNANDLASLKRKIDILDLDTSNWTRCGDDNDDDVVYEC